MPRPSTPTSATECRLDAVVTALPFDGDDHAVVRGILAGHPGAVGALHRRYAAHVQSVLLRVLGFDQELADVLHDAFVRALQSLGELRDPGALKPWLTSVAVFTARTWIQRRMRQRWLRFLPHDELPEPEAPAASGEMREAVRATYKVLDGMPADERVAFALRVIDGMELTEVASACRVSLSTIRRRLVRAEARFRKAAQEHPVLRDWLEGGLRWNGKTNG